MFSSTIRRRSGTRPTGAATTTRAYYTRPLLTGTFSSCVEFYFHPCEQPTGPSSVDWPVAHTGYQRFTRHPVAPKAYRQCVPRFSSPSVSLPRVGPLFGFQRVPESLLQPLPYRLVVS